MTSEDMGGKRIGNLLTKTFVHLTIQFYTIFETLTMNLLSIFVNIR